MARRSAVVGAVVGSTIAAMIGAAAATPGDAARTAAYMDRIADSPPRLRMFLSQMPKGGDLHNHGGGAIYAEDFLAFAAKDGLCLTVDTYRLVEPPCDAPNRIAAATLAGDYPRYSRAIDALSTRGFEAHVGDPAVSGSDRFFATFAGFVAAGRKRAGEALALTREQAAADRVAYVELSVHAGEADTVVAAVGDANADDLAALYARIAPALPAAVASARNGYDRDEATAAAIDGCSTPTPQPACAVILRYLYTAIRTDPPAAVFAQLATGFALASTDPRFVGVNIAAPEHDPIAIRDYRRHMAMIAWLHARFPQIALSLHAGELTLGLVRPRDLGFHIAAAVAAGARRIGHGVDISYEADAPALIARMARAHVAVEINLTSNAVILGVKGRDHPLSLYREAGVPVVLATDDEGVSRSDMTNEYLRAVTEQHLRYADLKQAARDSLTYGFLPGASLWQGGGVRTAECADLPSKECARFRTASPKAALQWQLETDLAAFEAMPR